MVAVSATSPNPVVPEEPAEVPASPQGFAGLGVSEPVVRALALRNITGTFTIQELVLADALAGRDVLASSRTGSGKTLAYALPIVERLSRQERGPAALVLVPTRELASQVAEEFRTVADVRGLQVATAYGGVGITQQARRARGAHVLIATPGRLLDLTRRKLVRLDRVRINVLDEADRMLDMGFLPDVNTILSMLPVDRQTMLFSATLGGQVGRLAARYTRDPVRHEVHDPRPVVAEAVHRFVAVEPRDKTEALVRELAGERGLTLVFARTRTGVERLAKTLRASGFSAKALHGGMTQPVRERTLGRFASGSADVLVATDVAARGLDLEHITHVVNFDPPHDADAYVHRVGRTARAGRGGTGLTLVTPEQRAGVSRMAAHLKLHAEFAEAGLGNAHLKPPAGRSRRTRRPTGKPGRRAAGRQRRT